MTKRKKIKTIRRRKTGRSVGRSSRVWLGRISHPTPDLLVSVPLAIGKPIGAGMSGHVERLAQINRRRPRRSPSKEIRRGTTNHRTQSVCSAPNPSFFPVKKRSQRFELFKFSNGDERSTKSNRQCS